MTRAASVTIPSTVNPQKLITLLTDAGWRVVGERRNIYARFAPPAAGSAEAPRSPSLLIPLNIEAPDYSDTMKSALLQLSENKDLWTRSIYPRLAVDASDEFQFCKESPAPSGLIPWRSGEKLVESARRTLLAGAKSFMGNERHFVNRFSRFAGRYLDQVLMGQTAPGSYIVTAYAPPNAIVPLRSSGEAPAAIIDAGAAPAREISEAVVRSVEATMEALAHYRSSGSLSGFEAGVLQGVSYEMTNAILGIASESSESGITVEWDPGTPPPSGLESAFTFRATDVEPLTRAAARLAEDDASRVVSIVGRVHILAKKRAGSPGVFGIDSLTSDGPRKVRVRLADEDDYHEAIRAHEEDLAIQVRGRLEREGNLNWLYDAAVVQTLQHLDSYSNRSSGRRNQPSSGQMGLFDKSS